MQMLPKINFVNLNSYLVVDSDHKTSIQWNIFKLYNQNYRFIWQNNRIFHYGDL